jgi:hypothetical protein
MRRIVQQSAVLLVRVYRCDLRVLECAWEWERGFRDETTVRIIYYYCMGIRMMYDDVSSQNVQVPVHVLVELLLFRPVTGML